MYLEIGVEEGKNSNINLSINPIEKSKHASQVSRFDAISMALKKQ